MEGIIVHNTLLGKDRTFFNLSLLKKIAFFLTDDPYSAEYKGKTLQAASELLKVRSMGDSSGEEFYSAPESDDDRTTDKNTRPHQDPPEQTLGRLSLSEESNPSKSESKNANCGVRLHNTAEIGEDDKTNERVTGATSRTNSESKNLDTTPQSVSSLDRNQHAHNEACSSSADTKVKQEFLKGLDNRFVSDDHEVLEGGKVELSEEQIKVTIDLHTLIIIIILL